LSDFAADIAAIEEIDAVPTILEVVCRTTGMGFAAVARVTEDRWVACGVRDTIDFGLQPGGELPVETTICSEIRRSHALVVVDHVAEDAHYALHPTPALYGFQSYISMPILMPDGRIFGTLCAIDPLPHKLDTPEVRGMFKLFAELIAFHLDAHAKLANGAAVLADAQRTAELREQFIAVLGHDLRNPLASIDAGMQLLLKTPLDQRARTVIAMVSASVERMGGLINDVLDFARGRLGGGLALDLQPTQLAPVLGHVVAELYARWPARTVETAFALSQPVVCDQARIAQLLSNLLGNALTHGAADAPVRVEASEHEGAFVLSVVNHGRPIPEAALDLLFQPFARGAVSPGNEGLGLGLYIASEVARAHGGTLTAASDAAETRFTLRMPMGG